MKQEGITKKKGRCNRTEKNETEPLHGLKALEPHTEGIDKTAHKY